MLLLLKLTNLNNQMNKKIIHTLVFITFSTILVSQANAQKTVQEASPFYLQQLLHKDATAYAKLSLEDMENILRNHRDKIFSDDLNINKFYQLQSLCYEIQGNADAKKLLPLLLKEITAQKVLDREARTWDETITVSYGGACGWIMNTVVLVAGEEGFTQIVDILVAAQDDLKLKYLVEQGSVRIARNKYYPILEDKLKTIQSPQFVDTVRNHMKAAATLK
jgi:hypothetical protein